MKYKARVALLEFGKGWSMWITSDQLPLTIGRGVENSVLLVDSPGVSRRHCMIDQRESVLHFVDVGSTNGTQVAGRVLRGQSVGLRGRTSVAVGEVHFWITPCDSAGRLSVDATSDDTIVEARRRPTPRHE